MAGAGEGSRERLRTEAVLRLLERMQDDLSRHQLERLRQLAELIGSDGRIGLDRALDVATPGGDDQRRQAAFRQFRRTVTEAAESAHVTLALVPDSLKLAPMHRFCWFEGEDPVLGELAAMSKDKSRRPGPADATVEPRVSQVRPPAPIRVHVCAASASHDPSRAGKVGEFIGLLRRDLRTGKSHDIQVTSTHEIELGLTEAGERERLREQADIVVALLTPAYLAEHESEIAELAGSPAELLLVAFAALPGAEIHDLGLRQHRVIRENSPYDSHGPKDREQFAADVTAVIGCLLDRTRRRTSSAPDAAGTAQGDDLNAALVRVSRLVAASRRSADAKVDPRASEIGLDPASIGLTAGGRLSRSRGEAVLAVDRLVEWASSTGPDVPKLCALLGDLGMGKTTTAKLFTERLLSLRGENTAIPVPVLFDLRDISVAALPAQPTLAAVLTLLLKATGIAGQVTTDQVLAAIARGNCVVIFDGLDEVLVHLDPQQGQLFVRALWQVIGQQGRPARPTARNAETGTELRPPRLLLTCRTHYFRSIRDEVSSFTGQDRDGPAGRDYLALLMLPFGEEQVRAYLAANVPGMDVDALLVLIDSIHDLRELTERPLTLSYVTEQLEFIERAKLGGRTIRPADLYGAMVERWLARDGGKHVLLPEHKLVIMEALAAKLWRRHRTSWSADDLEQWLLEFLRGRPDLELHYGQRRPDLWKEDLRTATFLVRRGDDQFSFAHTSLLEYFLSRYLLRALMLGHDDLDALAQRWTMPRPSRETLDFLGQGLAGLDVGAWQACHRALAALAAGYQLGVVRAGLRVRARRGAGRASAPSARRNTAYRRRPPRMADRPTADHLRIRPAERNRSARPVWHRLDRRQPRGQPVRRHRPPRRRPVASRPHPGADHPQRHARRRPDRFRAGRHDPARLPPPRHTDCQPYHPPGTSPDVRSGGHPRRTRLAPCAGRGRITGQQRTTCRPDRPHQSGVVGGLPARRHPPRHRQQRRHGADLGRRHRRAPGHPDRPHQSGLVGGLPARRHPPGHRQRRQDGADLGRRHRRAPRAP